MGNRIGAASSNSALFSAALVCLILSQIPASAQGDPAQSDDGSFVASDGTRLAIKAASGAVSASFAGTGRELKFGETDDSLANFPARESASEFRKLMNARPMTAPSGIESIIGVDQRTRVNPTTSFPARATVLIEFGVPGGTATCSGWLIGKDTVATAGHCVAPGVGGKFYNTSTYRIFPGRNGASAPYGSCTAKKLYSNSAWLNYGYDNFDYGAIKLNCNIGNTTGWFGFFWKLGSLVGLPAKTQGYPGDKPTATQWRSSDKVRANHPRRVFYQADTFGGQSGSAVWYNRSANCKVCAMAIHAYGTDEGGGLYANNNHGTRITQQVFNFLKNVKSR